MSHANPSDVEVVLMREMTDEESALADRLLVLAAAELRGKIADLDTKMLDPDFDTRVNYVETVAVDRILKNPDGYSYEVIGPYAVQRPNVGSGGFEFTASELAKLGVGSGAFSITPYMAPVTLPTGVYPPWYSDFPTGGV